ncbi:hypothetical protein DFP72DRAFT_850460 [Ephemerocybe angulata]|uniref:Uncharacterized protein n=1 Tax=Ephemerocybe angulata TaxID=980116 RepID=A0A8H6HTP9_9AGAR|nr:hypothetical protein DFP72DRAFT_850459 [Tulosesus angulatus]KAF6751607.1 hypothetical protein DFP72DRAFT_850460 [Tulosesus angulatus]
MTSTVLFRNFPMTNQPRRDAEISRVMAVPAVKQGPSAGPDWVGPRVPLPQVWDMAPRTYQRVQCKTNKIRDRVNVREKWEEGGLKGCLNCNYDPYYMVTPWI